MPSLTKAYFLAIFCEAILHGMYTILAGGALYLLLKRGAETRTTSNYIMIFLTVLMYCMSTVHIALALRVDLIAFFDQHATEGGLTIFDNQGDPLVYGQIALELINCLIGDGIVCWRTWILYARDWRVVLFPMVCIVGGLVSGAGMTKALSESPDGQQLFGDEVTIWFACFGVLTCIANLYSIVAITYKAWQHNRHMRGMGSRAAQGSRNVSVLLVIVESGAVYCVALVITVALFLTDNNGVYVISDMLNHLTGIYPTIIIVLVCLKITFHDDMNAAAAPRSILSSGSHAHSHSRSHGVHSQPHDAPPMPRPMLHWRGSKTSESDAHSLVKVSETSSYPLVPIRITTKTEQETWYDREAGGSQDHVLEISKKVSEGSDAV